MSDAVDVIIDKPDPEADVKIDKTVMIHRKDNPGARPLHDYVKAPNLPMVDLDTDEGVLAILDEGCNNTCHARTWNR